MGASLLRKLLPHHLAEAVTAIDRLVARRQEGSRGGDAALCAHRRVHLSWSTVSSAAAAATATAIPSTLVPPGGPASRAAARLVGEPLGREKFLFASCEGEDSSTVSTS